MESFEQCLVFSGESIDFTKSVGTLSAEQDCGYAQPGRMGHEGEAVLCRHRNQGVGRSLLCPSETVQRGFAQVSVYVFALFGWLFNS